MGALCLGQRRLRRLPENRRRDTKTHEACGPVNIQYNSYGRYIYSVGELIREHGSYQLRGFGLLRLGLLGLLVCRCGHAGHRLLQF